MQKTGQAQDSGQVLKTRLRDCRTWRFPLTPADPHGGWSGGAGESKIRLLDWGLRPSSADNAIRYALVPDIEAEPAAMLFAIGCLCTAHFAYSFRFLSAIGADVGD